MTKQRGYQRAYTACISCRRRKLRPCVFERKPKPGARQLTATSRVVRGEESDAFAHPIEDPATDSGEAVDSMEIRPSESHQHSRDSNSGILTDSVLLTQVSSENDALEILFQAAPSHEHDNSAPPQSNHSFSSPQDQDVLIDIWLQCPLVRQGVLSATEAIFYTDAFFRYLNPLSPVLPNDEVGYQTHRDLALHKPLLCCAVLSISSRYHSPSGLGGATRGIILHEALWEQYASMIQQLATGPYFQRIQGDAQVNSTLQAILLMVEWKPRAVHHSSHKALWPEYSSVPPQGSLTPESHQSNLVGTSSTCVIQPGHISDNMSWMLLSCALGLVHRRLRHGNASSVSAATQEEQLSRWRETYLGIQDTLRAITTTLEIEYQYTRTLISSVGLRAIAQRTLATRSSPTDTLRGSISFFQESEDKSIEEAVDGSCSILRVLERLHIECCVRYIPVRIVLRSITASVLLLKALSLKPNYYKMEVSLETLSKGIAALRDINVDEMHLGPRYATLIEAHMIRLKDAVANSQSSPDVEISVKTIPARGCLLRDECDYDGMLPPMAPSSLGIAGHEGARVVVAVRDNVSTLWKVGDRAGMKWVESTCCVCEMRTNGFNEAHCPKVVHHAVETPDGVTDEEAGPIMCGGFSAYVACKRTGVKPGEWLIILGARAMGMRVIAVDIGKEKEEMCRRLGADMFIHSSKDVVAEVMRITTYGAHGVLLTTPLREAYDIAPHTLRIRGTMLALGISKTPAVMAGSSAVLIIG
ncbi:alcohol dehydrogenase V [Fusarium denticulatum]|uniref:Alcohol dehydrogenase V n=1 Tax=Fusarium denticulatum TaxID=48507 RepID=A0A8H5TKP4_9HYPO|nr:alcohol dehydrogenase V [Fusarium denticulatum]